MIANIQNFIFYYFNLWIFVLYPQHHVWIISTHYRLMNEP